MTEHLQDILADCLERILSSGESIDSCLDRYPGFQDELEPLLRLALEGRTALEVEISPAARAAGRERVMAHGAQILASARAGAGAVTSVNGSRSGRRSFFPFPRLILRPVALATALMVLLSGGTAMAASGAEPDSFLYPVKRTMEDIRTVVAFQDLDQAWVEAGHADARLDEIEAVVEKDRPEYVPDLLDSYAENYESAIGDVEAAAADGEDTATVLTMIAEVQSRHDRIILAIEDDIPDDVRAEIEVEIKAAADREADADGEAAADGDGQQATEEGGGGDQDGDDDPRQQPAPENDEDSPGDSMAEPADDSDSSQPPDSDGADGTSNEGTAQEEGAQGEGLQDPGVSDSASTN